MTDVHIILAAPKQSAIRPLIQSEGFVIGVDGGASAAWEEDITLDLALGDFDSIEQSKDGVIKKQVKEVLTFPSEKDDTDAELALLYVMENLEAKNIYLYNWSGGRQDHLYSLFMLVLQERFEALIPKLQFISESNRIAYYLPGEYQLNKEESMDYLSFILLTSEVSQLTIEGAKYSVKKMDYQEPRALISNEFLTNSAYFSFEKGIVAVIQSRDYK